VRELLSRASTKYTRRSARKKGLGGKTVYPLLWILPSVALMVAIVVVPIVDLFITSFSEVGLSGLREGFNGVENYVSLFQDPVFPRVLINTVIWTVTIVGITVILSLGIASLLNEEFVGRRLVRSALIVPWAVSLLITAVIWKWIFDFRYGTLNLILKELGIIEKNVNWLAQPATSFPAMIAVGIFVSLPFTSFVLLAGLQAISAELYEAARVDGANRWKRFVHITLPQLRPTLTVAVVLNTIYVFNSFPIVWAMTRGEPLNKTDIIFTYLYKLGFEERQLGVAAAVSVISFLILIAFSASYVWFVTRREN
jgi:multiple sugar transport system permease protein